MHDLTSCQSWSDQKISRSYRVHERLKLKSDYSMNIVEYSARCELTYLVYRLIKMPGRESMKLFPREIRAMPDLSKRAQTETSFVGA